MPQDGDLRVLGFVHDVDDTATPMTRWLHAATSMKSFFEVDVLLVVGADQVVKCMTCDREDSLAVAERATSARFGATIRRAVVDGGE